MRGFLLLTDAKQMRNALRIYPKSITTISTMTPSFTDSSAFIAGTSLVGKVLATYDQLVATFGTPHASRANGDLLDRISAEWCIRSREGIFTIYDYGNYGPTVTDSLVEWSIGGHPSADTHRKLHPVAKLVRDLTGCPVMPAG